MCWVTIDGQKLSGGVNERDGVYVLKDKDHNEIRSGMEVRADCIVNGEYINFKVSQLKVLSSGSGAPQQTQSQPVEQQPTQQGKVAEKPSNTSHKDDLVMDMCVGFASAMALVKFEGKELPADDLIQRVAKSHFDKYKK